MPRLWFLNQTHDCRVYQNKSVQDILTAVFTDAGLTVTKWWTDPAGDFAVSLSAPANSSNLEPQHV